MATVMKDFLHWIHFLFTKPDPNAPPILIETDKNGIITVHCDTIEQMQTTWETQFMTRLSNPPHSRWNDRQFEVVETASVAYSVKKRKMGLQFKVRKTK